MEFEKEAPITDEMRRRASLKQTTVNPLDPFIKQEEVVNPVVTPETHANVAPDSESTDLETGVLVRPSKGAQPSVEPVKKKQFGKTFFILIGSLLLGALGGAVYFVIIG